VSNARAGIDTLHVPFQGSGAAMAALLNGTVDYAVETPAGALTLVRQGQLRSLGQTLARPTGLLPGMAPLAEVADLPGFGIGGWNGLMDPAGLPRPIAERLTAEMREASRQALAVTRRPPRRPRCARGRGEDPNQTNLTA
jgi:tripartite-type tricarboxylate transporter receptor subunit TctC